MIAIIIFFLIVECNCLNILNSGASEFGIDLIRSIDSDNVVMAPFLVWNLMAGLTFYATGEFKERLLNVLRLPKDFNVFLTSYSDLEKGLFIEKSKKVNITCKVFVYTSTECILKPEFNDLLTTYYRAIYFEKMNNENNEKFANRANDLVFEHVGTAFVIFQPQDFVDTSMIISSAVSFECEFKSRFRSSDTVPEVFYKNNISNRVLIMQQTLALPYLNMPALSSDVMELALGDDGKFCLLLIVPDSQTSMKEVYKKLNTVTIKDIFDKLQSYVDRVGMKSIHLKLPKVRIETAVVLNKPLSDIGLKHLLGPEKSEFSRMANEDLYIETIDHSCEVVITEYGVYAIATTPGYLNYNKLNLTFEAEKPFIFFVMAKATQTVLLGGLYSKPRNMIN